MHSTRADVIRLFNQCLDQKEACEFTLEKQLVDVLFSGGVDYFECAKRLPPETVMFVEIAPLATLKFDDLQPNKRNFKTFNPTAPSKWGFKGYLDESDGLIIKEYKGRVIQLDYIASANDVHLCRSYYDPPESFIEVFDGHVPFVWLDCPKSPVPDGEQISILARSDFNTKRGFSWAASTGKVFSWAARQGIIAGQNTPTITIDTTGLSGQTLTVRADVRADLGLAAVGECKIEILVKKF